MLPRNVTCEDCGQIATVRGFGRIEYDWPQTTNTGHEPTTPTITCVRLTIDCPHCGVTSQEFFPNGPAAAARHRTLPFPKVSMPNRRQFGVR